MPKKKIWANFQRIIELFIHKTVTKLSKIWVLGSGIRIRDPEKTYSGSRIQGSKRHRIPDPQHCCLLFALLKDENWKWVGKEAPNCANSINMIGHDWPGLHYTTSLPGWGSRLEGSPGCNHRAAAHSTNLNTYANIRHVTFQQRLQEYSKFFRSMAYFQKDGLFFWAIFCYMDLAVFRINDILRQRRILGSVHWITDPDPAFEMPTKNNFFKKVLLLMTYYRY